MVNVDFFVMILVLIATATVIGFVAIIYCAVKEIRKYLKAEKNRKAQTK